MLDEVVLNVIEHGHDDDHEHRIDITLRLVGDLLTIQVVDDGRVQPCWKRRCRISDPPIEERPIGDWACTSFAQPWTPWITSATALATC